MLSLRTVLILAAAIATARGAPAALQFTEVSRSGSKGAPRAYEVLTDGDRFSATSPDGRGLFGAPGSYIVGTGAGKLYIVYPAMRAYARFDRERIAEMSGQIGNSLARARQQEAARGVNRTLANFKFEKVLDEAGPPMFGSSHPPLSVPAQLPGSDALREASQAADVHGRGNP